MRKVLLRDFHFAGESISHTEFENWMGSCVATVLAASPGRLKIFREHDVKQVKSADGFTPDTSHVDGMVLGELGLEPGAVRLTLTIFYRPNWYVDEPKSSEILVKKIPLTDAMLPWIPKEGRAAITPGTGEPGPSSAPGPETTNAIPPTNQMAHPPSCTYCPDPSYPEQARQERIMGTVVLRATVGSDGRAHDITVVKGLGDGLDEAAKKAMEKWEFRPALDKDGQPCATIVTVQIQFKLR